MVAAASLVTPPAAAPRRGVRTFPETKGLASPPLAVARTAASTKLAATRGSGGGAVWPAERVTLVGVTGGTGSSAVAGFLAAGVPASSLTALTRDPTSARAGQLAALGINLACADLDDPDSVNRAITAVGDASSRVYVHALAADSAADGKRQQARARHLASALAAAAKRRGKPGALAFNSAAGVGRAPLHALPAGMRQKGEVEAVFRDYTAVFSHTHIRPAMFMEEWWKKYTRPGVLQRNTLTLALPLDAPLQLTAVRDVGLLAAHALCFDVAGLANADVPFAGDELAPRAMAAAFATAQGTPVRAASMPAWPLALLNPELHLIVKYLRDVGDGVDVKACRAAHPWLLSFAAFLDMTRWADPARSYERGITYEPLRRAAEVAA